MPLKERDVIPMSDPRVAQIGHPAPPWMVNYADLMTEMVCFFIILYALSAALNKDVVTAKTQVQEKMKAEKIWGDVQVSKDGMAITLEENAQNSFFDSGSADLSPRLIEILAKLAPTLRTLADDNHDIVVEGHTDNVPIRGARFSSNWELSTARATSVVTHLIDQLGFPPQHMAAMGYGEFRPIVPNDTDEHRAMNRRVVFFVKNRPAQFIPGNRKKAAPDEDSNGAMSDGASENGPPGDGATSAAPANTEPTTDQALPLPEQAPAEPAGQP